MSNGVTEEARGYSTLSTKRSTTLGFFSSLGLRWYRL